MGSIPLLRPKEIAKVFERLGWEIARQRGSHIIMTKPGHLATLSIPDHHFVARGALRNLMARSGITTEDFLSSLGM